MLAGSEGDEAGVEVDEVDEVEAEDDEEGLVPKPNTMVW